MRKLRYREIKYLTEGYSSGTQRLRIQIQPPGCGGPAAVHQAVGGHCLRDARCVLDSHGRCNTGRRQMLERGSLRGGSQPDYTSPCWTAGPLLPSALLPKSQVERNLLQLNSPSQPCGGGFLARTLESFQLFTPPPPGRELK